MRRGDPWQPLESEDALPPSSVHRVPMATAFRSTWLASSLKALRERNLLGDYFSRLSAEHRETVRASVAGAWLPISLAIAHYEACDALRLSAADQFAIGVEVSQFAQKSSFSLMLRLATESGMSPWSCFDVQSRLWKMVWIGGDVSVRRLGPKEARMAITGWPCARIPYCRNAMRGMLTAQTELFSKKAYVAPVSLLMGDMSVGYRIAWV
jgi:hypothetical protein